MGNNQIDNKLNEINERNKQNAQEESDEKEGQNSQDGSDEEGVSEFDRGRLAALRAKYDEEDEPKKRNQNNEGSTGENSEDEKGEEEKEDEDEEEKDPEEEKDDEPEKDNDDDPKENNDDNKKDTDDNKEDNNEPESQIPKPWRNGPINKAKNKAKEWVKKNTEVIKQKAKKAVQAGAKKAAATVAKLAAKLGLGALPPVLIIVLIIVAIIFIIGVIGFFSIMGDMIIGKTKGFLQGVWDGLETTFSGDQAYAKINEDEVKDAASYLEQMGYDLIGMGFVKTEYNTLNKNEGEAWNKWYNDNGELIEEDEAYADKKDLIEREEESTEDGSTEETGETTDEGDTEVEKTGAEPKNPIKKIQSEPIRKYLVASLRTYVNGAYGGTVVQKGHEEDGIWNTIFDEITFNSKEHTLTVTKGNTHVKVNLESWTAKYGMAFEFLICLHLGTLSPEFVMDLAGDKEDRIKVVVDFFTQERNKKI